MKSDGDTTQFIESRNYRKKPVSIPLIMKKYRRLLILITAILGVFFFLIYYNKYKTLYNVMSAIEKMSFSPKKRNMSTLHDNLLEDEHLRMNRWFWDRMSDNILVYSAYHDIGDSSESVKIFGLVKGMNNENLNNIKCLLWYSGRHKPDEASVSFTFLQSEIEGRIYRSAMISCHVLMAGKPPPYGASLYDSSTSTAEEQHHILKVLSSNRFRRNNYVSVCVIPPLSGPFDDLKEIIQFLEMYKIVGFTRFIFYDFSISDRIQHLLLEYVKEFNIFVEVMHWNFPVGNNDDENFLLLAKNDCIYRTMGYSNYTLFTGLSQYVIPRQNIPISSIVSSTVKSYDTKPILNFYHGTFCDEFPDDPGKLYLHIFFSVLLKTNRINKLSSSRKHSKLIPVSTIDYLTSNDDFITIDHSNLQYVSIKSTDALMNIYRSCKKEYKKLPSYINDNNALKYKELLLSSQLMARIHYNF